MGGSIYMPSKNKIIRENHALSTSQNRNSTCPSPKCDSKDVFKNHAARNYTNQTSTVHNYQQGTHLQLLNNLIRGVKKNLPCLDVRIFIKSSKFCFLSIRLATIMA